MKYARVALLAGAHERFELRAFLVREPGRRWPAGERRRHLGRHRRRQVDVNAEQPFSLLARHRAGDGSAPIAALRNVAGVAEALHQFRPGSRDTVGIPTSILRPAGEAVTRHGRDDDVEGVLGATAMRGWIRERIDDLKLLDDGSRPAVGDDDRKRIRVARTDVDEVNVDAVDLGDELRQSVHLGFGFPPVVSGAPIPNDLLKIVELRAL